MREAGQPDQPRLPSGVFKRAMLGSVRLASATGRAAMDFLVPPVCLGCHQPLSGHDALCARCWRTVRFIRAPLCDRLGIPMAFDSGGIIVSAAALADPPAYDRARAAAHFDGVLRDLVHGLKYADRHDARRLFGRWLAAAGHELLGDADVLVPVPLHRWRLLTRRFNQAAILAQEVGGISTVTVDPYALVRRHRTVQQVGLTEVQRRQNVAGAFMVPPSRRAAIEGRNVVLVDDVITTGATINACARALKAAGAARVDALALGLVVAGEIAP